MNPLRFPLSWQILLAMLMAILCGYMLPSIANAIGNIGDLYIKLLSLVLIPSVVSNVINGVSYITKDGLLGRLTLKNLSWFVGSQFIAMVTAVVVANLIGAGNGAELYYSQPKDFYGSVHNFGDFIINIFPDSIFNAFEVNNVVAVFVFCTCFGYFASRCSDKTRIFIKNMFTSISEIMQQFVEFVAKLAPIGIFCVLTRVAADSILFSTVHNFMPFLFVVALSLSVHSFVILPSMVKVLTGKSAYKLMKMFGSVLYTAFGVRSSYAVVPQVMSRMKKELGLSPRIADFVVPMGALTNYNGSAIYYCATAIFVSQAYGIEMSIFEDVMLFLSVSFISFGTSDIPLVGAVAILPILDVIGLPKEGFAIIIVFDTLICMFTSFVDAWSNICASAVIAGSEGENLSKLDKIVIQNPNYI